MLVPIFFYEKHVHEKIIFCERIIWNFGTLYITFFLKNMENIFLYTAWCDCHKYHLPLPGVIQSHKIWDRLCMGLVFSFLEKKKLLPLPFKKRIKSLFWLQKQSFEKNQNISWFQSIWLPGNILLINFCSTYLLIRETNIISLRNNYFFKTSSDKMNNNNLGNCLEK